MKVKQPHAFQATEMMVRPTRHAMSVADPEREHDDSTRVCTGCGEPWPCPAVRDVAPAPQTGKIAAITQAILNRKESRGERT